MKKRQSLPITNSEIRRAYNREGSYKRAAKFLGINIDTVIRGVSGARQCPSRRPGNLKY